MDSSISKVMQERWIGQKNAYFALLSVQVELVLADSHDPNGFNQRMAGIPCVDQKARLSKSALCYCSPVAARGRRPDVEQQKEGERECNQVIGRIPPAAHLCGSLTSTANFFSRKYKFSNCFHW